MLCTCYRTDLATLVAALSDAALLARYQEAIGEEIPSLADRTLVKHLRRMTTCASRALAGGFEALARDDAPAADELLSDLFAVATFRAWPLPIESIGERELAVEGLPRGLLGADASPDSARVWVFDHATVAISRSREAGDVADMSGHSRA